MQISCKRSKITGRAPKRSPKRDLRASYVNFLK